MRKSNRENRNPKFGAGNTSFEFRFSTFALRAGRDQGSALAEYAIVLMVLLTFLFGIMDFSRFLYTYHFVSEIAREGTRYAVVRGATFGTTSCASPSTFACNATAANVQSYVQGLTPPGITPSSLTVTTTWPGTAPTGAATACNTANGNNSPGCLVQVAVSYPYKFILPFLPKSSSTWTVSSTSVMVIAQ
jgi:Flp pilus assembly protein TadG